MAASSGDTIFVDDEFVRAADELAGKVERKSDTIGIETSRLIVRRMQYRSYEGSRLVCIIPEFHNVPFGRDEVYNALLKELEEPDPGKLFLITAEQLERILPTVRSRSVLVRFDPLGEAEIERALVRQYGEDPARAASLARRAQGSLGDALALRDEDTSELRDASRRWVLACLTEPDTFPPMPLLQAGDARAALDTVLRHARLAVRDVLAFALNGEAGVLDAGSMPQYKKALAALGSNAAAAAVRALMCFDEAVHIAATNVPPSTTLGWLQIQLRSLAGP